MEQISVTHGFFNAFKKDTLCFAYMGHLTNQLVISAINLIEQHVEEDLNSKKIRHKLSFLMIESFQNILRYGDEPANKKLVYRKEMFMVRKIEGTYYIASTNLIENKKIEYVKSKLNEVNELDTENLHQLYRKILTNNKFTSAGGAGLGFIEMARKTNEKLQFDFEKINDEYSYFYLLIKVKIKPDSDEVPNSMDINTMMDIHQELCNKNIVVLHKGNFSPVFIDPVIYIVENNIKSKAVDLQRLTFNIIIEALQNVSHHSLSNNDEKEAIFIIGRKTKKQFISTGNFIKNSQVNDLKAQLDMLLKINKKELHALYDETLAKRKLFKSKDLGIGLIEIAMESKQLFTYDFNKISDDISFYTLNVMV
jgi:hypothetical protein